MLIEHCCLFSVLCQQFNAFGFVVACLLLLFSLEWVVHSIFLLTFTLTAVAVASSRPLMWPQRTDRAMHVFLPTPPPPRCPQRAIQQVYVVY